MTGSKKKAEEYDGREQELVQQQNCQQKKRMEQKGSKEREIHEAQQNAGRQRRKSTTAFVAAWRAGQKIIQCLQLRLVVSTDSRNTLGSGAELEEAS